LIGALNVISELKDKLELRLEEAHDDCTHICNLERVMSLSGEAVVFGLDGGVRAMEELPNQFVKFT